jgi:hypothetical protein
MNQQSLDQANALLAEVRDTTEPGGTIGASLGELGRKVGLPSPLSLARAVRALVSRGRLGVEDGQYRLLDDRPIEMGERVSVAARPRRSAGRKKAADGAARDGVPSYADLGRAVIDRLIELARETAALADLTQLRRELREERSARARSEERANELHTRARDLEAKLQMAEENLRRVIGVVRQKSSAAKPTDPDAQALLAILRGGEDSETPEEAGYPGPA